MYSNISINVRQINCKYIIATNSFRCAITIFRLYNMEENLCMYSLKIVITHIKLLVAIRYLYFISLTFTEINAQQ